MREQTKVKEEYVDQEKVSLATVGGGAAIERFDIALQQVVNNILDVNTDGNICVHLAQPRNADRGVPRGGEMKPSLKDEKCPHCGKIGGLFRCSFGSINCADCMQYVGPYSEWMKKNVKVVVSGPIYGPHKQGE